MGQKWFGVKILVRTEAVGRPRVRDADYDPDGTLVEERVVVVRAGDAKEAFVRARRAAEIGRYRNAYGQKVRQRVLKGWDAYEMFDAPGHGREVFSDTRRVARSVSDATVVKQHIDKSISRSERARRRKFIAADLAQGLDSAVPGWRLSGQHVP
jgi:hypothetical protein